MRVIVDGAGEGQLHIRGDFKLARARTPIGDRESSNLGIVFGRDEDFE